MSDNEVLIGTPQECDDGEIIRQEAKRELRTRIRTATREEFDALLSRYPMEETGYDYAITLTWGAPEQWERERKKVPPEERQFYQIYASGPLTALAVVYDREDILGLLLERGYMAECKEVPQWRCGYHIIHAIEGGAEIPKGEVPVGDGCFVKAEETFGRFNRHASWGWAFSPLALAVLMGHTACVRQLLRHGVGMEEAHGVSWAMNLAWREHNADYRAAREAVLQWGDAGNHRPQLEEMTDCSLQQLRAAMESYCFEDREYMRWVNRVLHLTRLFRAAPQRWRELCRALGEVAGVCPQALVRESVIEDILWIVEEVCRDKESLLAIVEGRQFDVTDLSQYWISYRFFPWKEVWEELSRHCELKANYWRWIPPGDTPEDVEAALRCVSLYDGERKSRISARTEEILEGETEQAVQRLWKELNSGLIRESTADLLCWLTERFRQAVLAAKRDKAQLYEAWKEDGASST